MLKHIVLAAFLTAGAAAAYAQPQQAASPPAAAPVDSKMADSKMAPSATADTRKLIGRNIKNADGETIGEIKSIYINKDGKVDSKDFTLKSKANSARFMLEANLDRKNKLLDELKGR